MELTCPACNTANPQPVENCVRCGCELGVLWEIQNAAWEHLEFSRAAFGRGDPAQAYAHALRSWELVHSARSAAVAALASALLDDAQGADLWLCQFEKASEPGGSGW